MKKEDLVKQDWVKHTTYDEPRLSEITEMYQEMGLEVRIEPLNPDENGEPGCSECMKVQSDRYETLYTRKKNPSCR